MYCFEHFSREAKFCGEQLRIIDKPENAAGEKKLSNTEVGITTAYFQILSNI
jgi:hypothetical protein